MEAENLDLFEDRPDTSGALPRRDAPLADALRPMVWEEFRGLQELDSNLVGQLKRGGIRAPSLILWGPPGSGKTTLAKLVGKSFDCNFVELSAVLCGVKEVREVIERARRSAKSTLLFVDEIHRFNKGQQDAFLPHVESGLISLIGATTENPSFALTSALLSRMRLLVLPALSSEAMLEVLRRGAMTLGIALDDKALQLFASTAGGDARKALNLMESAAGWARGEAALSCESVESFLKESKSLFYDRSGEEHYNIASAFIKSMRGSDPDAALFWAFRMIESGEDPRFIIRRMIIFASEDIGNADPRALTLAVATSDAYERVGLPEGKIPIAQCVTYLASAPKSNRSYMAMHKAIEAIKQHPRVTVPLHLRNAPTALMKSLDYGKEYQYPHSSTAGYVGGVRYLPEEISSGNFYEPSEHGAEKIIAERLARLRKS